MVKVISMYGSGQHAYLRTDRTAGTSTGGQRTMMRIQNTAYFFEFLQNSISRNFHCIKLLSLLKYVSQIFVI